MYQASVSHVKMIDVSEKDPTFRTATAEGGVWMRRETLRRMQAGQIEKGDVLTAAQLAGIMGAKKTPDLIPMCHPLPLTGVTVGFDLPPSSDAPQVHLKITATARVFGRTGAEMEAITAVCVAALTVYDMCKGIDPEMCIGPIGLLSKTGGRSGDYARATPLLDGHGEVK